MSKSCPKCLTPHQKAGAFCGRSCANSRTWSDEDKKAKSITAKQSIKIVAMGEAKRKHPKRPAALKTGSIELSTLKSRILIERWKDPERRRRMSDSAKRRGLGGIVSRKTYEYYNKWIRKVCYLQSTYEVTLAENLDHNHVRWDRPSAFNWIDVQGLSHRYYPDFLLLDYDVYLDPKNDYLAKVDADKIERVRQQNVIQLYVLTKSQCQWDYIKTLIQTKSALNECLG